MVSKLYCDRCKKEMKLGEQSYVKVNQVRFSQTCDGNAEVCEKCAKEIIKFVRSK